MTIPREWLMEHHGVTEDQVTRRKEFLIELETLMRSYNVSISHQDGHGAFELEDFDDGNLSWLRAADGGLYK